MYWVMIIYCFPDIEDSRICIKTPQTIYWFDNMGQTILSHKSRAAKNNVNSAAGGVTGKELIEDKIKLR